MFKVIYGMDTIVATFDSLGDAATDLMARGRGYAIWDADGSETTYEELMLDA